MTRCYVGLGSNLGNPRQQILQALDALASLRASTLVAYAPGYSSRAVGPGQQPDYINTVAALDTQLQPEPLLDALQAIEAAQGRERAERWGARTLDLDLLLYGDLRLDTPRLKLPHPRLKERDFVLRPLLDLAPGLTLPCGTPIESLLARCPSTGLQALGEKLERGM